MLFYCWATVPDVGPTLKQHWVSVSCLMGHISRRGIASWKCKLNNLQRPIHTRGWLVECCADVMRRQLKVVPTLAQAQLTSHLSVWYRNVFYLTIPVSKVCGTEVLRYEAM